jgi:hypothetical protein
MPLSESGELLCAARPAKNPTQDAAAGSPGMARTNVVMIGKGQRPLRLAELQDVAHLYVVGDG